MSDEFTAIALAKLDETVAGLWGEIADTNQILNEIRKSGDRTTSASERIATILENPSQQFFATGAVEQIRAKKKPHERD